MKHDTENGGSQTIKISHPLQIWKGSKIWSQASNAYNCRWLFEMSQGVNDKQCSCYSISNHKTGWYHTHEVLPAVPLISQRAVAGIIQGAKGELGSQWVKNVQVIQSLIIYQSRFNIHCSNYPRRWAGVRTGQQLILRVTHFSVSVENRDITTAAHFVPIHFFPSVLIYETLQFCNHSANRRWSQQLCLANSANLPQWASPWMIFYLYGSCVRSHLLKMMQSLSVHIIILKGTKGSRQ